MATVNKLNPLENLDESTPQRSFRSAFARAKKAFKPVLKSQDNPYFHSKYASLSDIHSAVDEALLQNGFTLHQLFHSTDLGNFLTTKLCHLDGHTEASSLRIATKDDSDPQKLKSAATYYRRIQLEALLGIATEDDDGNRASETPAPTQKSSEEFRFRFGKFTGKTFSEAEKMSKPGELSNYIGWLMSQPDSKKNQPIKDAYLAWLQKSSQSGHKDFEEPPPHNDFDTHF